MALTAESEEVLGLILIHFNQFLNTVEVQEQEEALVPQVGLQICDFIKKVEAISEFINF